MFKDVPFTCKERHPPKTCAFVLETLQSTKNSWLAQPRMIRELIQPFLVCRVQGMIVIYHGIIVKPWTSP